jgi:uncharacterized protein with PIN domain
MAEREKAEPKLLCDEMLMRLGRWPRAAGYDTAKEPLILIFNLLNPKRAPL